jgi:membrane fusion protein (multidrug efflux system)
MNRTLSLVAQIPNLLYRRLAVGWVPPNPATRDFTRAGGLKIRDTADWKSVILVSVAAVLISGCKPASGTAETKPTPPPPSVAVKTVQPRRGEITRTISLPATIAANQQVTLYSKAAGYLKTITVDKGDEVKTGQLLAEIEVPELLADFARYQAEAEIADLEFKRSSDARQKSPDLVVQQTVDATRAKSLMAKANLERAETLLGFCKITAPFSGVITRRMVDPGAFVPAATSGSAAQSAAVVTLMDFNKVRVQVAVPEAEVPLVKNGLPVKVLVDGLAGRVCEGSVTRFSQALDDASKTMLAEIDLDNPKRELRPGMFVTAKLGVEKHTDALLVPIEAAVFEKAGASVFTVADGKAKKTPVKTGFNDGAWVEILEGLTPNTPVILVGRIVLVNGQPVNVTEGR